MDLAPIQNLPRQDQIVAMQILEEMDRRKSLRKIDTFYPDTGPLRRELYKPHQDFFIAGAIFRERAMCSANRIGKSEGVGAYEVSVHLTGQYPSWWDGRRFDKPVNAWACGSTSQTVRDIVQFKLLGTPEAIGTGMIPGEFIKKTTKKAGGVPDAIESVAVRHASGGVSRLVFKSYDQKRKAFEGTEQDLIWMDEEPPMGIYGECIIRTMATSGDPDDRGGIILLTFTPLLGLSEVVLQFFEEGKIPEVQVDRFCVQATWDDAPHLTEKEKAKILQATPPYLRKARSKGIPQLGSGAIFPLDEEEVQIDDFEIPSHWPRCYALDVGWNWTAALWMAWDRENDVVYIYNTYKRGKAEPPVHKAAIEARGDWIPGVIDPAAGGSGQRDGKKLVNEYQDLGLQLTFADHAVEAGLLAVWQRLTTGSLRVFKSCRDWFSEFRIYRRDEKGKIVKVNDHLMDDTRYGLLSGLDVAIIEPFLDEYGDGEYDNSARTRNKYTGY